MASDEEERQMRSLEVMLRQLNGRQISIRARVDDALDRIMLVEEQLAMVDEKKVEAVVDVVQQRLDAALLKAAQVAELADRVEMLERRVMELMRRMPRGDGDG